MTWNVDKAVQWAQLAVLVIGLVAGANTCSRAFDKIDNHEERIVKIEKKAEERDEKLSKTLSDIKEATSYLNWRMDSVVKQLEGKKR